ncbi:MAG: heavy metal translocating P-type ATPase [Lachnospiraceae bacterium]|nr:heavy metal translocating P-type ATPase [Lachnospiraceae bacterium]
MTKYTVTGMSCAACQARVEKAVGKVAGVSSCAVSLLTNSMGVEGDAAPAEIIKAVEDAGYGAALMPGTAGGAGGTQAPGGMSGADAGASVAATGTAAANASSQYAAQEEMLRDHETPVLKKRLNVSVIFLFILMYFSMGHHMLGLPLPAIFAENMVANGLVQMLLAGIVMVINQRFFISGFKSVLHGAPNMDTLVALGSGVSFAYSFVALVLMSGAQAAGDHARVHELMNEFYFESAAMIVTLITVGKMLEAMSKGRTTDALKGLMKLAPKTATLLRDGQEVTVGIEAVRIDDIFVVRPGENIPVDGIVAEGMSAVNESALTGESIPVDKAPGDAVSAGTINTSGFLQCRASRVGEDTTLSQIIRMVSDAAATKAPIARMADKVSAVFVPAVIAIAVITFIIWMFVGQTTGFALARAISVLVISCPCALGLATPVAIMVGNGIGARNGILFKTSASLEQAGRVTAVALDKTGTITKGEPVVTDIISAEDVSDEVLLIKACALEAKSEHPLARAVMALGEEHGLAGKEVTDFEALPGNGLCAFFEGRQLIGGNAAFMNKELSVGAQDATDRSRLFEAAEQLAAEGKTPLFFAEEGKLLGVIAVADVIKEDSAEAIAELREMGIRVTMLTGDNERTAAAIGAQAGVDEVVAGVLPAGKVEALERLSGGAGAADGATGAGEAAQSSGRGRDGRQCVAFVGDGINDAPALTQADVGIAIGAGTDVAIDAADVVLMKSTLMDAAAAIRLSRATLRNIHQNLFWAFIYNVIGIPIAAGAFIRLFGWTMNPMFGAAAMSLSSFCVCMNALRLNLVNIRKEKEVHTMQKTMMIEGMMCEHCENTVKKALEALDGVESAAVSHEKGEAVVTLTADVADDVLKEAVEAKDYTVKAVA